MEVILAVDEARAQSIKSAVEHVAGIFNLPLVNVAKWCQSRDQIFACVEAGKHNRKIRNRSVSKIIKKNLIRSDSHEDNLINHNIKKEIDHGNTYNSEVVATADDKERVNGGAKNEPYIWLGNYAEYTYDKLHLHENNDGNNDSNNDNTNDNNSNHDGHGNGQYGGHGNVNECSFINYQPLYNHNLQQDGQGQRNQEEAQEETQNQNHNINWQHHPQNMLHMHQMYLHQHQQQQQQQQQQQHSSKKKTGNLVIGNPIGANDKHASDDNSNVTKWVFDNMNIYDCNNSNNDDDDDGNGNGNGNESNDSDNTNNSINSIVSIDSIDSVGNNNDGIGIQSKSKSNTDSVVSKNVESGQTTNGDISSKSNINDIRDANTNDNSHSQNIDNNNNGHQNTIPFQSSSPKIPNFNYTKAVAAEAMTMNKLVSVVNQQQQQQPSNTLSQEGDCQSSQFQIQQHLQLQQQQQEHERITQQRRMSQNNHLTNHQPQQHFLQQQQQQQQQQQLLRDQHQQGEQLPNKNNGHEQHPQEEQHEGGQQPERQQQLHNYTWNYSQDPLQTFQLQHQNNSE
eukprot:Awhi_evm1s3372